MTTVIVVISILLQLSAAAWAIRLIRYTGRRAAWYLISVALTLMAVRRIVSLLVLMNMVPAPASVINEYIGFVISMFMFIGVLFIEGYFRHAAEADREVREREHLFHRLFESGGEGNLLIDNGVFIDCNRRALDMLGIASTADLVGRDPSVISPPTQPDGELSDVKARRMIERGLTEGSIRFEWTHTRGDGSLLPVDVVLTAIPLHGRTILHTSWRDISARRRAEQALQESLQTSEDIIRSMPSGLLVFQFDAATGQFLLTGGNGEAERMTGIRIADSRGMTLDDLRKDWPRLGTTDNLREVIRTGEVYHLDPFDYDNGKIKAVFRITVFRLPALRLVIAFEDITAQRRREESIRLSEERHRSLIETMGQGVV